MTTTLTAPDRISRRGAVTVILNGVPSNLDALHLVIGDDPTTTSSFFDEFVRQVLVDGLAQRLVIETNDEFIIELATDAATAHSVSDRLSIG